MKGFFALFPKIKKVRSWLRTRGRNCSPSRAHPRGLLSWRAPSSGCGSGMTTLASLTTGTDALERLPGSHRLASRWCGSAKGMRRDWSGTGTRTRASLRLTSLLFLGVPPAQGGIQILGGLRVRFVSVHRHVLDIPVMLQRQVSAVPLCRSRCASFSGHGRPCDHTAYVPAVL